MTSLTDLAAAEEKCTAAPWTYHAPNYVAVPCEKYMGSPKDMVGFDSCDGRSGYNAEFIALLRNSARGLLKIAQAAEELKKDGLRCSTPFCSFEPCGKCPECRLSAALGEMGKT